MASPRNARDDAPRLDLESPRMIAAMKVTGIDVAEIAEPSAFGSEVDASSPRGEEAALRRAELMERKRRQLLKELDETAATLDESLVEAILHLGSSVANDGRTLLASEKQKIDQKREKAKSEMQKELQREIERKQAYDTNQRSREDWKKRTKEKNDEKADELAKRFDEKAKRHGKQQEALNKSKKEFWSQQKETMKRITESNERVTKQAEERKETWASLSEDRRRKMADIANKNLEHQRVEEEDKMKKFEMALAKQREREERMEKAAKEALEQKRSKFADKMTVVTEKMTTQQNERERVFKENAEKLEKARQTSRDHQTEMVDRIRTTREKEHEKWTNNREKRRKENHDKMKKLRAEITDGHQKSIEVREKHFEEMVYKKAEGKGCMEELVQQNKDRIARRDECAREQTLAKIRHTKDKINSHIEQRKEVVNYRTNALRDEMIGRTQLNELKTVMRDASTKRINQLLKEIGMPPLSVEHAKEEEEADKKQ